MSLLGPREYMAWTKEAHVHFRRAARTALTARFVLDARDVEAVREEIARAGRVERRYAVALTDAHGHVCADCEIVVHLHTRRGQAASSNKAAAEPAATAAASTR